MRCSSAAMVLQRVRVSPAGANNWVQDVLASALLSSRGRIPIDPHDSQFIFGLARRAQPTSPHSPCLNSSGHAQRPSSLRWSTSG